MSIGACGPDYIIFSVNKAQVDKSYSDSAAGVAVFDSDDFRIAGDGIVRLNKTTLKAQSGNFSSASDFSVTFRGGTGQAISTQINGGDLYFNIARATTGVCGVAYYDSSDFNIATDGKVTLNGAVKSLNGATGHIQIPIVSSVNGLTGIVGISAGSNITIITSGNTFTISASSGGVAGFTLTTIDFSAAINQVQFDVFTYTASYLGSPVYDFASKGIVEQLSGLTAIMQNTGLTVQIVGTVETVESYRNSPMPTDIDFYHTITMSPPFYGATSGLPYTAEEIVALNPTELLGSSWVFSYDPVGITNGISLLHKEETYVVKTITGQSWVAADTFINCKVLGLTTDDHDPEDAILEGVRFEINNIVPATGFDIIGHAPEGTYGKYKIKCLGQ